MNEATLDPQVKFSISELKSNVHKFPGNFLRDVEFLKKNKINPSFGEGGFNLSHLNPPIPKEKKPGPLGFQEFMFLTVFVSHSCLH